MPRRLIHLMLVPLALLVLQPGCGRAPSTQHYKAISGSVMGCKPDTGEVIVRVMGRDAVYQDVVCQVTRDSELFINDRLAGIEEIRLGDTVDLIGYNDVSASIARFVVSSASVVRDSTSAPHGVRPPER
jgi:hypothetical protein